MNQTLSQYLADTARNTQRAAEAELDGAMEQAIAAIVAALAGGKPLLVCGNGGSMADALHIAGELVARFKLDRKGLKVIALGSNLSALTAWGNDVNFESHFAREVEAFGEAGGILLGLSTSGNSANVVAAVEQAKTMGMGTVAMTGAGGGHLGEIVDILLAAPVTETARVQETHLPLYHYLCQRVEEALA
ncbi:MAG: phosphoheptose isomerase [Alphaproteobacteria bacterium RIFOXYD12_FULL_60_8]|nr:MAG: phosphoheptose isomerase [Alphaproteobacteria bacterium RIFOXYD12_FULL_60_8]